jgi:hypothetical protein
MAPVPHGKPHSSAQLATLHARMLGAPLATPGCSPQHCDRQAQSSGLQTPMHWKNGEHAGSVAQALDSLQQFVATHEAQSLVPYGKPQALALAPASAGALKY